MSLTPSLGTRRLSAALQILKLQAEIQDVMSKAEAAGEEGDVDVAQELMEKVEELQRKKASVQGKLVFEAGMEAPGQWLGG